MKKREAFVSDAASFIIGCAMFGASVNIFIEPGEITMGGFTGISTTIGYFFNTPVGLMIFLLNLPLLALRARLGKRKSDTLRAVLGIVGSSAATDILSIIPYSYSDSLLCALLGGALMGAGSGMLMRSGFTTGGSDLLASIIKPGLKRLSYGKIIFIIDAFIIIGAALLLKDYGSAVFSFAAVWCYTTAFDKVLSGREGAVIATIVSEHHRDIAQTISERLRRGVTVLPSSGWYTGKERPTLICAIKKRELYRLREIVRKKDPDAFVVISGAAEVMGEGFEN